MYPVRWLLAFGLGAFVLGLVAHVPARLVVERLPLAGQVQAVSGTWLDGALTLSTPAGPAFVDWQWRPAALFGLAVGVGWQARLDASAGEGRLALSPATFAVVVDRAEVAPGQLNRVLGRWRTQVGQPLLVRGLSLSVAHDGGVRDAGGQLLWSGGRVTSGNRPPVDLPALRGQLTAQDGRAALVVDGEAAPGEPLADLVFDPAGGELHVRVLQRGALLAGAQPTPGRSPDTVVFEVRQALH